MDIWWSGKIMIIIFQDWAFQTDIFFHRDTVFMSDKASLVEENLVPLWVYYISNSNSNIKLLYSTLKGLTPARRALVKNDENEYIFKMAHLSTLWLVGFSPRMYLGVDIEGI